MQPTVAILTDFGLTDPYVGIMKGVIARLAPSASILDITHGVPPQDVLVGALLLDSAAPFFPPGTVFLVVVDPGVGSARRIVACRLGSWFFVCPDNGLLTELLAQHPLHEAVEATEPAYHLPQPSRTFHGRDIMAPVAAHLAAGVPLDALGPRASELSTLPLPKPVREEGMIVGEGLYTDHFGNIVTNVPASWLSSGATIRVGEHVVPLVSTYAQVEPGALLALVGSTGRLELSVNGGSAAAELGEGQGAAVIVLDEDA